MTVIRRAKADKTYRLIDIRTGRRLNTKFPVHQIVEPHNLFAITTEGDGIVSFPVKVTWWCTCGIYTETTCNDGMLWEASHQHGWHRANDPRLGGKPPVRTTRRADTPTPTVVSQPQKPLRRLRKAEPTPTPPKRLKKPQKAVKRLRKAGP